jgi:hypothetical protein
MTYNIYQDFHYNIYHQVIHQDEDGANELLLTSLETIQIGVLKVFADRVNEDDKFGHYKGDTILKFLEEIYLYPKI